MFYKCYSKLIDTFKVLYAALKAFNFMYSKGQLVITDKKIESRQEQTRRFLIKI